MPPECVSVWPGHSHALQWFYLGFDLESLENAVHTGSITLHRIHRSQIQGYWAL